MRRLAASISLSILIGLSVMITLGQQSNFPTGVNGTTYINCASFSGSDDSLKIQSCLTALYALNTQSGIADARLMTGRVWSVNPFVGGSNIPTSGVLLMPPGLVTTNVPIVPAEDWEIDGITPNANTGVNFGIGGRATGTILRASSTFPTTYTTGTVTVGTAGFHDVITGSGTGWTTSNIAVGCMFVAPAGGLTNETYGIIEAINSTTSITLGWGVNPTGTPPGAGSSYDIFCPVYSAGGFGNSADAGFEYGYGLQNISLDANNLAGVVPYVNWYGGQFTYARNVSLYNYCGMGFDLEGQYAQNSGPYESLVSFPGTCGVAGTLPFHIAETGGGPMGFSSISFNNGLSSTNPSVGMALDGGDITVSHIDAEAVGIGVDIGDNIACIPACAYPGEGSTGPPRGFDVFEVHGGSGSVTTLVKLGNANGGPTGTSVRQITPGSAITNLLIDTANSCTMSWNPNFSLGQYTLDNTGKIGLSTSYTSGCRPIHAIEAGTCTMSSGTCTFTYTNGFHSTPVCTATWNGTGTLTGIIKAVPGTSSCVVTSSVGTDSAVMQVQATGNTN